MQVKDLIRSPVTTCSVNTNIGEARDLMLVKKFSALPVVEISGTEVRLKGIVSHLDLVGVIDDQANIQQVMSSKITSISPEASIKEAASLMLSKRLHHLVVMDDDQIKGIISSFDFLKIIADSKVSGVS